MSSNRLESCFRRNSNGTSPLLPYFTSGYPDLSVTAELIRRADAAGATVIELGFPYSDSIADGPVIQESFNQVLARGQRVEESFALIEEVRASIRCALVAMVSLSVVHRIGLEAFMVRAAGAGFDGVILPDVPVEEGQAAACAAREAGLCLIGLVAPTTSAERREAIAREASGFIYHIAATGTTGERSALRSDLPSEVAQLRRLSGLPVCVGFGISTPEQVKEVCGYCDGAIVGSAIVRRIAQGIADKLPRDALVDSVSDFISQLIGGVADPDDP